VQSFRDDDTSTPLSFRRVCRRQGSTSQNTNTYYILRTRAEGIQPPAEAVPRTLPDRSLDRAVEGGIGLEKEANRRLARGMWMVVALCAHLNNSENGRHKEIFPYRQLLARSFWYCAFVHALEVTSSFLLSGGPSRLLGKVTATRPYWLCIGSNHRLSASA
jgi:hypothetical protein